MLFFTNFLSGILAVLCQALNYTKIVFDLYVYIYIRSNCLAYTCQNVYYLINTLTNINDLLISNLYYLVSILTNTDNILKVNLYHLANTITNTNDKANNSTKKRLVITFNLLLTSHHKVKLKNNNFIP